MLYRNSVAVLKFVRHMIAPHACDCGGETGLSYLQDGRGIMG